MRVLTYNTHLFGQQLPANGIIRVFRWIFGKAPTEYRDPLRAEKIANYIRNMAQGTNCPDVVGLCEIWDENLSNAIINHVRAYFPHIYRPARRQISSDWMGSGLTLLSRLPFAAYPQNPGFSAYGVEAGGWESKSQKGYTCAIIEMPGNINVAFFLTHAQSGMGEKNQKARGLQFKQLALSMKRIKETYPDAQMVACGDFNVIGESETGKETDEHRDMLGTLQLQDAFRTIHSFDENPGFTSDAENRLLKTFDRENHDQQRLDYILVVDSPRIKAIDSGVDEFKLDAPLAGEAEVNAIYHLSDHYGVWAEFELGRHRQ
jgi:endonuclease/exonuclease/phosphatase family metal-dependent hydrolase